MFSGIQGRILASVLASVVLHGVLAGGVLVLSGDKPDLEDRVYSVMLVDVLTLPAEKGSPAPAPEPVPQAPEPPAPTPVPEEKKIEEKEARQPKPIAARTRPAKKNEPVRQPEAPPPNQEGVRPVAQAEAPPMPAGEGAPTIFIGGLAAYAEDAVDERPFIVRRVLPEYPARARRMKVQGRAEIRLIIDSSGQPREARVHKAEPAGYFEAAALAAARATRFSPGKVRGRPVNTAVIIPFVFSLR